ncbi:MAG: DNA polymerase III subunit delta' [Acetobacteraceae bacterium]|nr:DNA polymerase III subunit delta' [Acetobacteraceae bacterium]
MEPRENPDLFGHEGAETIVAEAIAGGRLHHAWLISGKEGIGKATLAYRFARRLLTTVGEPNDPANPVFRRVARGTHADLLTVEREWDEKRKRQRTEIVVDDARDIAAFLRLTPAEGGWRVVVVDGAEHLNRNAANALLKVLEEPPARAVLLLTCAAPGRLLPTIRSRCRRLALLPLAAADMGRVLARVLPEQDAASLIPIAGGSPGRAALLAAEGGVAMAGLVEEVLRAAPNLPVTRAYEIADRVGRTEGGYSTFMDLLRDRLGSAVREAARGGCDPLMRVRPLEDWGEVWHALGRLQDETERANLEKRHAIVAGLDLLNAP